MDELLGNHHTRRYRRLHLIRAWPSHLDKHSSWAEGTGMAFAAGLGFTVPLPAGEPDGTNNSIKEQVKAGVLAAPPVAANIGAILLTAATTSTADFSRPSAGVGLRCSWCVRWSSAGGLPATTHTHQETSVRAF
ncbi:hypothetical protein [Arthrobacter sp.]|uniref:hypothetical protein n=1 Tax=Arthrobacter sp. TaxID=1667 RepID=UPI002897B343|nr:hypothetical protein [Arthrobacter sp.]